MERTAVPRRPVLRSIASLAVAGSGLIAAGGGAAGTASEGTTRRTGGGRGSDPCERPSVPSFVANHPDTYLATVDRVVDGAHVVILLEEGDRVVDQVVVPADEYPCLEERDRLVVRLVDREPAWMRRLREQGGDRRSVHSTRARSGEHST